MLQGIFNGMCILGFPPTRWDHLVPQNGQLPGYHCRRHHHHHHRRRRPIIILNIVINPHQNGHFMIMKVSDSFQSGFTPIIIMIIIIFSPGSPQWSTPMRKRGREARLEKIKDEKTKEKYVRKFDNKQKTNQRWEEKREKQMRKILQSREIKQIKINTTNKSKMKKI